MSELKLVHAYIHTALVALVCIHTPVEANMYTDGTMNALCFAGKLCGEHSVPTFLENMHLTAHHTPSPVMQSRCDCEYLVCSSLLRVKF